MDSFIKQYEGKQEGALAQYLADKELMAAQGYFPVSQNWVPRRRVFLCVVGIILCPIFLTGVLILLFLLFTQPNGCMNVTYAQREKAQSPAYSMPTLDKTCPKCAELVKDAAAVCRFCNYEFASR
jgi:hypothetical protein